MKKLFCILLFIAITLPCFAQKVIVIYKPNKDISVIHPIYSNRKDGEGLMDFLERVRKEAVEGKELEEYPYDIMDIDNLPAREDRKYWEGQSGEGVIVNTMKKNKAIKDKQDAQEKAKELKAIEKQMKLEALKALKAKGKKFDHISEETFK